MTARSERRGIGHEAMSDPSATRPTRWAGSVLALAVLAACATTPDPVPPPVAEPVADAAPAPGPDAVPAPDAAPAPDAIPVAAPAAAPAPPPAKPAGVSEEDQARARGLFKKGEALAKEGVLAAALAAFEEAAVLDPLLVMARYNAGVLCEKLGNNAQAKGHYIAALALQPELAFAAQNLTRLRVRSGQLLEAERDLRIRINNRPEDLGLRNQLVELFLSRGDLDAAFTESKRILKSDERNVIAMIHLATYYQRQKKYELAMMVLDNALQIAPAEASVHHARSVVYLALGQKAPALESLKKATEARPDFPEAQNNLGVLLIEAQDYYAAALALEKAVKSSPDFVQARLNLGNAYRGARDYKKALEQYELAFRLGQNNPDTLFDLALTYLDGGTDLKPGLTPQSKLDRSLAFFESFKKAGGDDPRLPKYVGEAQKGIEKERRRVEREEKDKLRKIEEEKQRVQDAKKKAEEEKQRLIDEARRVEEEKQKKIQEEIKKAEDEMRRKAAEAAKKKAEEERLKKREAGKIGGKNDLGDAPPGEKVGGGEEK